MITDIEVTATERIGKLFCKLLAEVDIDIAEIPLAVPGLQIAGAYVIDHGIAEDIVQGILPPDLICILSENDAKFAFIIQAVYNIGV